MYERGELVYTRDIDTQAISATTTGGIQQVGLDRPDLVNVGDPAALGVRRRFRIQRRLEGEVAIGCVDGVECPQLAREFDEIPVGVAHVDRLNDLVTRFRGHVESLRFEAKLP